MDLQLENKIIIVSGGAKGIVKVLYGYWLRKRQFLLSSEEVLKTIRNLLMICPKNLTAYAVVAELTQPEECRKAIHEIITKFGRIDGLVNNAGVNDGVGLENGSYEAFMQSLHKNLVHYYLLAHYALPALKESKGSIVNIGSKTSETGQGGTSAYAASNGGRSGLTREWAELLPYSIRVNAVIVAEAYTPLYEKWIKTFDDPEAKLKSITDKIPLEKE